MMLVWFLLVEWILLIGLFFYLQYRNNLVFRYRVSCVEHSVSAYDKLPSYNNMMYAFIKWPDSKLKKGYINDKEDA